MRNRISAWLFCAALAASGPLFAFTYVHVADPSLARQADLIVRAEVFGSEVEVTERHIWTRYTMWVEDVVKGDVDGAYVTVRVPGGRSEALGIELAFDGAPRFDRGEEVLLFLRPNDDGSHRVLHFAFGAFWKRSENGTAVYVRPLPEPEENGAGMLKTGRDAERFVEWLRDETSGRARERDYLVGLPADSGWREKFTIFDTFQAWAEFQNKPVRRITWQRHKIGQKGVPGKGKKELKKVFNVLNGTPDSRGRKNPLANLALKGKVSKLPADRCSGSNLFVFEDTTGTIGDAFDCVNFGPLAVGGSCRFTQPSGTWKGRDIHHSSSALVVYNKGTECYYRGDPPFVVDTARNKFAEVTMHEVMHTLGLVHSCGDSRSPNCSTSAVLDDATMRARAHADGRGAQLREDDLSGFWFLYDPDYLAAPCHLPPGHKNFCKECGPCGEGQGACRKNSQCFDGLKCKRDVAAGFKTCQ